MLRLIRKSLKETIEKLTSEVREFHVAPQVNPEEGLPYHEWLIEFEKEPKDLNEFGAEIDKTLQKYNSYYKDLITGGVLSPLKITPVSKNGFREYTSWRGKYSCKSP